MRRQARAAARAAPRRSWGTWSSRSTGRRARACPTAAAWRRSSRARRSARAALARRARRARLGPGPGAGGGARDHRRCSSPSWRTTATRPRATSSRSIGHVLGVGIANVVNILNPEVVVRRRRRDRRGRPAARAGRARVVRRAGAGALARRGADRPARFGDERGDDRGAALLALEDRSARRSGVTARPARRLPDADRQPRGRHAARAQRAARGRRRRLRGHAPHAGAARPLRRQRDARQLPRAQRAPRARPSSSSGCPAGRDGRAGQRRRACRSSATRASCSCRPAWRRGWRSRSCRGRARRWRRWSRAALPAETWRFVGFLPRKRGELEALLRGARETLVAFESPRRVGGVAGGARGASTRERPVAVCRELTKIHEEVVRGTARRAGRALRGARSRAGRSSS